MPRFESDPNGDFLTEVPILIFGKRLSVRIPRIRMVYQAKGLSPDQIRPDSYRLIDAALPAERTVRVGAVSSRFVKSMMRVHP